MLPTPEAIALLERYFSDAMEKKHLHSFYTCCGKCSDTSEPEASQINVLCMWWLVYCAWEGMFCLLSRVHNTKNKYNKQNTFNSAPSTIY
ncbi:unnamed protein product, partial [Porites evermanni]